LLLPDVAAPHPLRGLLVDAVLVAAGQLNKLLQTH
jgi:hypothetical protein